MNRTATLTLPEWLIPFVEGQPRGPLSDPLAFAIDLSAQNVERETGGPFGAVLVDKEGMLVSVGVNLVVPEKNPTLHGEMVAIIFAAGHEGRFNLSDFKLYSSAEPCAMCAGAIHWAGVSEVYYAASSRDVVREAGFDEGPVHPDWHGWNEARGNVVRQLQEYQEAAVAVLRAYKKHGEPVYNSLKGG